MKRPGGLPRRHRELSRSALTAKRGRPKRVNAKRKASEFARCYGSRARVQWVKRQPCVVVSGDHTGPIENAHVGREGAGMGRKANADQIAPMCHHHHCTLHQMGAPRFENIYSLDLPALAAETDHRFTREHAA